MHELKEEPSNFIRQIIDDDLASGKCSLIHTRFPPEPNGYLHLGHAKSICLNFSLANLYQGECNLRLDDTDPIKEQVEYIEAIQQDIRWLGYAWDGAIHYASDYFPQLYQFAVELIQQGLAYVDQLSAEEIRTYRGTLTQAGQNSPYRDRPVHESLALFEQMRLGHVAEGTACLRARIDMASPFIVLRDPVLYRIKWVAHHQTGTEWCIYPMYDFAHPICDALENITHSLCTLEFQDNRRLYDWVLQHISIAHRPRQYEFSRLNIEYTLLSKRKLDQLVTQKKVSGWDDPRMPTLAGLRRRGYTPAAVREFCRRIGITKQDHQIEMSLLESCIRDDLNQNAPRAMAVLNPLKLIIENFPSDHPILLSLPNHPNKLELGYRQVPFGREIQIDQADFREQADKHYKRLVLGKSVRLRHAYVITAQRVERDMQGQIVAVYCRYDSETLGRNPTEGKVQGVIHWVAAATALPAEFRLYDRLFKVPNPGLVEDFLAMVDPDSLIVRHGVVEPALQQACPGDRYQFEREGYFCLDACSANMERLVFNRTVALSDRWSNKKR